ncbi:MAG: penicillin-binding protein activator LpoB, partial [Proteobacteria bacterium]|nr:penicillin-binding protein activator LpoB [Pseudomonadota bacterium]
GNQNMFANLTKHGALLTVCIAAASSCTKSFEGEYQDPQKVEIIDDKWNETDARKTSQVMITSCLGRPWLEEFKRANTGKKPIVIVQDIENRSDEHIDTKSITEFLETELVNSGKVRFVEKGRREQILKEVEYQNSGAVSDATKKKKGNQIGADFMLAGAISSQVHTQEGIKTVSYQTQLKLINLESAEIQWTEKHEVKKKFKRSGASW